MADNDVRLESLEDEVKVLKGEVKRTLVDLRALLMREDSPLGENGMARRAAKAQPAPMEEPSLAKEVATVASPAVNTAAPLAAPGTYPGAAPQAGFGPGAPPGAPPQAYPGSGMGISPNVSPQPGPGPGPSPSTIIIGGGQSSGGGDSGDAEQERRLAEQERRAAEQERRLAEQERRMTEASIADVPGLKPEINGKEDVSLIPSDDLSDVEGTEREGSDEEPAGLDSAGDYETLTPPVRGKRPNQPGPSFKDDLQGLADDSPRVSLGRQKPAVAASGAVAVLTKDEDEMEDGENGSPDAGEPASSVYDEYRELMRASMPEETPVTEDQSVGPPLDVNLLSSLVYWASLAKQRVGEAQIKDLIELYIRSGHSRPELQELLLHICDMVKTESGEYVPHAEEWVDLMFHLHGILTGSLPAVKLPTMTLPSQIMADAEDQVQ